MALIKELLFSRWEGGKQEGRENGLLRKEVEKNRIGGVFHINGTREQSSKYEQAVVCDTCNCTLDKE